MNQTSWGLPFFGNSGIVIHPKIRTLKLQYRTIQLTERVRKDGKISALTPKKSVFENTQPFTVKPSATEIVSCSLTHVTFTDGTVAMVESNPKFEKETGLCVTSAIVKLDKDIEVSLGIINALPHKVTIPKTRQLRVLPFSRQNKRITYNQ